MAFIDLLGFGSGSDSRTPDGSGRSAVMAHRPDDDVILEMRDRAARAEAAQRFQRQLIETWRRYHTEHYSQDEYERAAGSVVETPHGEDISPPQALLQLDKISGPAEEYMEKYRESGLDIRFSARSRATPGENVTVMNGLMKRFDNDGGMAAAEASAMQETILYGMGVIGYRQAYVVESVDPGAPVGVGAFDQTLEPVRIQNPERTILVDPSCKNLDWSDASWLIHRTWMSREDFVRLYPNAELSDSMWGYGEAGDGRFRTGSSEIGDPWYRRGAGGGNEVAVADYYRVVYKPAELRMIDGEPMLVELADDKGHERFNPLKGWNNPNPKASEDPSEAPQSAQQGQAQQGQGPSAGGPEAAGPQPLPAPVPGGPPAAALGPGPEAGGVMPGEERAPAEPEPEKTPEPGAKVRPVARGGRKRRLDIRRVEHIVASGHYVLDRTWAAGDVIPFVPVLGHEMQSEQDGTWRYGLVYLLADVNRAVENILSDTVNYAARIAKVLFIGPDGFTAADPRGWGDIHHTPRNTLEYTMPQGFQGGGQGASAQPPTPFQPQLNLSSHLELMRWLNEEIGRLSGTLDVPSTQDSSHDRSAQSIIRLNAIGTARHEAFLRNMQTITLRRKGQILARMIPKIWDRAGRMEWIKGTRPGDKDRPIYIRAPFVETPDGPELVPCPKCGGTGKRGGKIDPQCRGHGFASKDDLRKILDKGDFNGRKVHYIDLSEGALDAETRIGSKEKTGRQEAINMLQTLMEKGILEKEMAVDQLVAAVSQDVEHMELVYERLRRSYTAMHPEEDESRDAVLARLKEAQQQIQSLKEEGEKLKREADKVAGQKAVAQILAASGLQREQVKAQTTERVAQAKEQGAAERELAKIEAAAKQSEADADAEIQNLAQKGAFQMAAIKLQEKMRREREREMAAFEGRIKLMIEGIHAGAAAAGGDDGGEGESGGDGGGES